MIMKLFIVGWIISTLVIWILYLREAGNRSMPVWASLVCSVVVGLVTTLVIGVVFLFVEFVADLIKGG